MSRYRAIGAWVLVIVRIVVAYATFGAAVAYAKEKDEKDREPENGAALVKVLHDKYGVTALLNREGKINIVDIEDAADLEKATDRVVQIPTIEEVRYHFELERKHVEGKIIKKLGQLPKLARLNVIYCQLTDEDTSALEVLKNLKKLELDGNPITDAALAHFKPMQKLEFLYLSGTKVTGTGFKHLRQLPRLSYLVLAFTPITDESMKELGRVYSLEELDMDNTKISAEGVMHLTGLYRLFKLVVDAKVSDEFRKEQAVARAQAEKKGLLPKRHPKLSIISR